MRAYLEGLLPRHPEYWLKPSILSCASTALATASGQTGSRLQALKCWDNQFRGHNRLAQGPILPGSHLLNLHVSYQRQAKFTRSREIFKLVAIYSAPQPTRKKNPTSWHTDQIRKPRKFQVPPSRSDYEGIWCYSSYGTILSVLIEAPTVEPLAHTSPTATRLELVAWEAEAEVGCDPADGGQPSGGGCEGLYPKARM